MPRPSKPLTLHVLHGTGRKSRIAKRKDELRLESGSIGECPDWVSPEAKEEWNRLLATEWAKVLAPSDRAVFLRYCIMYGQWVRVERGLKKWIDGKEDEEVYEKLGSQDGNLLHQLSTQLALTPASRSKIHSPNTEAPKSKWAEIG